MPVGMWRYVSQKDRESQVRPVTASLSRPGTIDMIGQDLRGTSIIPGYHTGYLGRQRHYGSTI